MKISKLQDFRNFKKLKIRIFKIIILSFLQFYIFTKNGKQYKRNNTYK